MNRLNGTSYATTILTGSEGYQSQGQKLFYVSFNPPLKPHAVPSGFQLTGTALFLGSQSDFCPAARLTEGRSLGLMSALLQDLNLWGSPFFRGTPGCVVLQGNQEERHLFGVPLLEKTYGTEPAPGAQLLLSMSRMPLVRSPKSKKQLPGAGIRRFRPKKGGATRLLGVSPGFSPNTKAAEGESPNRTSW